ncbi:hypothetical protein [Ferruginibacter albus]|uniref:hypothetical protein n=1 Tax=Ferruginibacter albus TaxID=2875540 RepID=UPI001CC47A10|nr:hypothetical protein [Ferruginibacter albus]UAY52739.1 hypothetical protein K9M53_03365 [Ferruginibacter albus]
MNRIQTFIEKYFSVSHDISATLIVTLLTFALGFIITGIVSVISKYLTRRTVRKMFLNALISLNKTVKAQEQSLSNTIRAINFEENSQWLYQKADFYQLRAFKEIGYIQSFNSLFNGFENYLILRSKQKKNLRRHAFNKMWSILNSIEFWSQTAFEDFYKFEERYNEFGDKRNSAIEELRKAWEQIFISATKAQLQQQLPLHPAYENYLNQLNNIIVEYSKIPTIKRVGPYITNRKLILKIRILNKKAARAGIALPFLHEFNDKCMVVSSHYIDMEYLARNVKIQYAEYKWSFYTFSRVIKKIAKIL